MPESESMGGPAGGSGYDRRELLRRGLVAGASAAAFGATVASLTPEAAAAAPSSSLAVSVALASHWPWGATVDAEAPFYLSPGTGQTIASSASSASSILGPALLVVPLLISVDVGSPAVIEPPFTALILATGDGLAADTVQLNIPFAQSDRAHGHDFTRQWLGIVPIILGSGSIQLQGTVPAAPAPSGATAQAAGSTLTVTGDFSQAPLALTLSTGDQISLVSAIASQSQVNVTHGRLQRDVRKFAGFPRFQGENTQSGFAVANLFTVVSNATTSARATLLEIQSKRSAISIGDMFEMQMLMNHLSQLSETSTGIISAANTAITSLGRNLKG